MRNLCCVCGAQTGNYVCRADVWLCDNCRARIANAVTVAYPGKSAREWSSALLKIYDGQQDAIVEMLRRAAAGDATNLFVGLYLYMEVS